MSNTSKIVISQNNTEEVRHAAGCRGLMELVLSDSSPQWRCKKCGGKSGAQLVGPHPRLAPESVIYLRQQRRGRSAP
jgi:hypothetical protein